MSSRHFKPDDASVVDHDLWKLSAHDKHNIRHATMSPGGGGAKPKKDKLDNKDKQLILKQYYVSGTPD